MWRWIHPLKEFTCGCLQPASAGRCWGGRRQPTVETTPASTATPRVAFLNPGSTGSSTTPPSPPKARWERWWRCSQTPTCTTSPATWRSTFPKGWAYRAAWRTHSSMKPSPPPAVSDRSFSQQVSIALICHQQLADSRLDGTPPSKVAGRASEAMWIFSTGLCAVVGVMVAVGVGYQIHLDRVSKRKKVEFQYQQSRRGRPLNKPPPIVCCSRLGVTFDPRGARSARVHFCCLIFNKWSQLFAPTWLFYLAIQWKVKKGFITGKLWLFAVIRLQKKPTNGWYRECSGDRGHDGGVEREQRINVPTPWTDTTGHKQAGFYLTRRSRQKKASDLLLHVGDFLLLMKKSWMFSTF